MATITTNPLNALLDIFNGIPEARWNYPSGAVGSPVSLTYSFLSSKPAWATPDEVGFGVLDASMKVAAEKVMAVARRLVLYSV